MSDPQENLITRIEQGVLAETEGDLLLDTMAANKAAALSLARQAQHNLYITSRHLDALLYDNAEFCEAVSKLARSNPSLSIRILVRDPEPAIKNGHRLIELARRLTSFIEIRRLSTEFNSYNEAILIADSRGVLRRQKSDLYESTLNFNAPLRAKGLLEDFSTMWKHSQQANELRRLNL